MPDNMETPEDYVGQVVDIYSDNVAAIIHPDGTEEPAHGKYTIDGRYKIIDYDEGNNEFALITEVDAQRGEEGLDFTPYVYYVEADSVGGPAFDHENQNDEVDELQQAFDAPSVEHPLGPHTGYKLDPTLETVLEEQMIDGGVPKGEVQPSIDDIEESMDEKLEDNDKLTSMKNKKGADIMNPGHQTPRYDVPFEEPADQEFTDEDYASVSSETNEKVIKLIREMRAAGVPMPEIMRQAREMIEASIAADKGTDVDIINQRFAMPNEHLGWHDEKFWDEIEGKEDESPDCPQPRCHGGKLEKEGRQDGRDDVWRCKSCKSRTSDADLKKTGAEEASFGTCPKCGVNAVDPEVAQCTNCGWDQDNACPDCFHDNSLYLEEDGNERCNNCGWNEATDEATSQSKLPPPATAFAQALAKGLCPKCSSPTSIDPIDESKVKCGQCGWEDQLPPTLRKPTEEEQQISDLEQAFHAPSVDHPLGPHMGAERSDIYGVWSPSGDRQNRKWLLRIDAAQSQQPPQEGDTVEARSRNSGAKPVILTSLYKDAGNYTLWETKNVPFNNEPWRPKLTNTQELYRSGSFVEGPDGRWLVVINQAGGQRPPEPGDWALIIQRSRKGTTRPVPLTLLEDMGDGWKFKNGHHPNIGSQASEDEAI